MFKWLYCPKIKQNKTLHFVKVKARLIEGLPFYPGTDLKKARVTGPLVS